jgi:glycosyltransferase involved in cell wall biosynthesis
VVRNGVNTSVWRLGPGGSGAVWSGRIVPEKAPHLAIDLARAAGLELTIAGPLIDEAYFSAQIAPRLGSGVRYAGHLGRFDLAELVRHSLVALITPVWNEPFGMVAAEAISCGTPVVALARGGLPEVVDSLSGRLLPAADASGFSPEQISAAVQAMAEAAVLDRAIVRERALARCSATAMLRGYERVYTDAIRRWDGP